MYIKYHRPKRKNKVGCEQCMGNVRPEAAGLLTGMECFRIRDSVWHVPCLIVTTRTKVRLVE